MYWIQNFITYSFWDLAQVARNITKKIWRNSVIIEGFRVIPEAGRIRDLLLKYKKKSKASDAARFKQLFSVSAEIARPVNVRR